MLRKKTTSLFLALSIPLALLLSACSSPVKPSGSPAATGTAAAQTMPAPSASAEPAATEDAVPTSTPHTLAEATPVPTGFVTNFFTASDGKYIYYFPGDGIHRMDRDGSQDRLLLPDCCEFIYLNAKGLYYLEYDREYTPAGAELEWQWCNSYNLMFYNTATQQKQTVRQRLFGVSEADGKLYLIDHTDHSKIYVYDTASGATQDLTGLTGDYGDPYDLYIWVDGETPYLGTGTGDSGKSYRITGNAVDMKTAVDEDTLIQGLGGEAYQADYENGTLAVWTGSAYKDVALDHVFDVLSAGPRLYVLTDTFKDDQSDPVESMALYRVSGDGAAEKITEILDVTTQGDEIMDEYIDGWFFSFWLEGDGGTVCALLMKQKVD